MAKSGIKFIVRHSKRAVNARVNFLHFGIIGRGGGFVKLRLMAADFEENWFSLLVPEDLFSEMSFRPMELEVDISPLLKNARQDIKEAQKTSSNSAMDAIRQAYVQGYDKGHYDTVEGGSYCPVESADDWLAEQHQ